MKKEKVVAVSGGFDPVHIGHIRLLKEAKALGDKLVVILNDDNFLKRKKGYVFMPQDERKEILESIKYVDRVVAAIDEDLSVNKTLEMLKPDIFANGGDRKTEGDILEHETCKRLGIKMVFGVGGYEKPRSSTSLVREVISRDSK
ncbi:MAG: adenylyltransferase/cytidyltransferase family protein [Dehalococcoidia bacterium]|nr:adenylyltransferase/cytidyltransferase family protein [Dehalococcoidia bacterium]